mgnify:FL=1
MCEKLVAFRDATRTVLVPDSLDNLVRGGRFPEEAAKQASVLNMRMMLTFNEEDGKVGVIGKSKARKEPSKTPPHSSKTMPPNTAAPAFAWCIAATQKR